MSNKPEAIAICFKEKRVYVHLKESKKESVETAIKAFEDIGVSDVPKVEDVNLYVLVQGQKVFFGCEAGCEDNKPHGLSRKQSRSGALARQTGTEEPSLQSLWTHIYVFNYHCSVHLPLPLWFLLPSILRDQYYSMHPRAVHYSMLRA
ncbi:hypothetical protein K435DRAFT_927062 [Dendrothele bispora CBS 962.96]|uniref:Uncharacterized protein n=1 Tax=Dendrothele bispora (strain CBS 962.96) TaxID=1314807 RepID=A0A4V4HCV6_DENBC|nr:hypothetical protein K435DRAFT_927062 [Dendrothele bispora CBS 962.96]